MSHGLPRRLLWIILVVALILSTGVALADQQLQLSCSPGQPGEPTLVFWEDAGTAASYTLYARFHDGGDWFLCDAQVQNSQATIYNLVPGIAYDLQLIKGDGTQSNILTTTASPSQNAPAFMAMSTVALSQRLGQEMTTVPAFEADEVQSHLQAGDGMMLVTVNQQLFNVTKTGSHLCQALLRAPDSTPLYSWGASWENSSTGTLSHNSVYLLNPALENALSLRNELPGGTYTLALYWDGALSETVNVPILRRTFAITSTELRPDGSMRMTWEDSSQQGPYKVYWRRASAPDSAAASGNEATYYEVDENGSPVTYSNTAAILTALALGQPYVLMVEDANGHTVEARYEPEPVKLFSEFALSLQGTPLRDAPGAQDVQELLQYGASDLEQQLQQNSAMEYVLLLEGAANGCTAPENYWMQLDVVAPDGYTDAVKRGFSINSFMPDSRTLSGVGLTGYFRRELQRNGSILRGTYIVRVYINNQLVSLLPLQVGEELVAVATATPTPTPTPKPTRTPRPTPTPTPEATPTPDTRAFWIYSSRIKRTDANVQISWKDSWNNGPYRLTWQICSENDYDEQKKLGLPWYIAPFELVDKGDTEYLCKTGWLPFYSGCWIRVLDKDGNASEPCLYEGKERKFEEFSFYLNHESFEIVTSDKSTTYELLTPSLVKKALANNSTIFVNFKCSIYDCDKDFETTAHVDVYANGMSVPVRVWQISLSAGDKSKSFHVPLNAFFEVYLDSGKTLDTETSFYPVIFFEDEYTSIDSFKLSNTTYLTPTPKPTATPKPARNFKITGVSGNADGSVTVRWTDSKSAGPYEVGIRSYYPTSGRKSDNTFYTNSSESTYSSSIRTYRMAPGVKYELAIFDGDDRASEHYIVTAPTWGNYRSYEGFDIHMSFKYRAYSGGRYSNLSYFSASSIRYRGNTSYGFYLRWDYSQLARARSHTSVYVIKDPNGLYHVDDWHAVTYPQGHYYKYNDFYNMGGYFDALVDMYGSIPTGTYTFSIYLDGRFADSFNFSVRN